jgi:hypothetical protein
MDYHIEMLSGCPALYLPAVRRLIIMALLGLPLLSCTPAWQQPIAPENISFLSRSETQTHDDISVTVAVPSEEETQQLFGTNLYKSRVQPVWISVENRTQQGLTLMRNAVDDAYISPAEAAFLRHAGPRQADREMDLFFQAAEFKNPVPPGEIVNGYIFTNIDEGFKNINVDLLSDAALFNFVFTVMIPGLNTGMEYVDLDQLYTATENVTATEDLQARLQDEACCTTNQKGTATGDPLNIVFIGERSAIMSAMIRRGWHVTEINHMKSALKTTRSFVFGRQYLYSPISPLYHYERSQDLGLQKARQSVSRRNHIRLWLAPYRFRDMDVFLGQISRDIGVAFFKNTLTTHTIDPYVDHTRDGLVGDLAYSQNLSGVGYVAGSQVSTEADTHYNLTPDPYYSDGYRAVFFFSEETTPLDEIDHIMWLPQWHPGLQPNVE